MTILFDGSDNLPPLHPKVPPVIPVEALLAVETVTLAAADIPRGILREFYTRTLGMAFVDADDVTLRFSYQQRHILLSRDHPQHGRLGLLVRNFSEALLRLRDRHVPYEILHSDAGLSRTVMLRDPAGNWIHLVETRPL